MEAAAALEVAALEVAALEVEAAAAANPRAPNTCLVNLATGALMILGSLGAGK